MDFETFKEKVKREINCGSGGRKAELKEMWRNNGRKETGLLLTGPGEQAVPVVYLEAHYKNLQEGKTFQAVLQEIQREYERHRLTGEMDVSAFTCWERAKETLGLKVINYQRNKELLKTLPHHRVLDLAVVYCCMARMEAGQKGTILVHRAYMQMWGISEEELKRCAYASHKKRSRRKVMPLDEVIFALEAERLEEEEGALSESLTGVYVAMDSRNAYGASVLLFPETFRELAERYKSSLYLLPSSIYEVMALPAGSGEPRELAGIVREINQTQVLPEEQLSDNIYRYDRERGEIELAWEWKKEGREKEADKE